MCIRDRFWAGEVGFYWTDGFRVQKISESINETYRELVSNTVKASRIHGTYDPNSERVIWTVSQDNNSNENDSCFVLDLRFGIRADSTFTTLSGGDSFKPSAVTFQKDPQTTELRVYRGDERGYILFHEEGIFTDPVIDVATDPDDWITSCLLYTSPSPRDS